MARAKRYESDSVYIRFIGHIEISDPPVARACTVRTNAPLARVLLSYQQQLRLQLAPS